MISFGGLGPIELRILIQLIIVDECALYLLHIDNFIHVDRILVDQLVDAWFVGTFPFAIEIEEIEDLGSILIALEEVVSLVIRAHQDHAQVVTSEASVAVQHKLFRTAWHA